MSEIESVNYENAKAIACLFGELVENFDESRHSTGTLFDTNTATWEPGCPVCAVGAALELLIPEKELADNPTTRYDTLFEMAKPEINRRLDINASVRDIDFAAWKVIGINDSFLREKESYRTFPEVTQIVRSQYACENG